MIAPISPLSVPGLALSLLCHFAGVPTLGSEASPLAMAQGQMPRHYVHVAAANVSPTLYAVRDFKQLIPKSAQQPMPVIVNSLMSAPGAEGNPSPEIAQYVETSGDVAASMQELALVSLINRERELRGEQPLAIDPLLTRVARGHSEDMCARGYFDHYAPGSGPVTPMDRYLAAAGSRPDYAMVGENIFYRSSTDSVEEYATEAHDAFMHSPGHRANILTGQYTRVGVGIYRNPATGEFWATEMFLRDTQ